MRISMVQKSKRGRKTLMHVNLLKSANKQAQHVKTKPTASKFQVIGRRVLVKEDDSFNYLIYHRSIKIKKLKPLFLFKLSS